MNDHAHTFTVSFNSKMLSTQTRIKVNSHCSGNSVHCCDRKFVCQLFSRLLCVCCVSVCHKMSHGVWSDSFSISLKRGHDRRFGKLRVVVCLSANHNDFYFVNLDDFWVNVPFGCADISSAREGLCGTMMGRLAALFLLSTLSLIQTAEVPHQISLTLVELGSNLTLTCSVFTNKAGMVYWYKLKFGYMFQTVAAGIFDKIQLQGQFNNSRFNITKLHAQNILNIRNVTKEDEAMYFCQAGSAYKMEIIYGTLLVVNDHNNLKKSIYVKQSPKTKSVQPGDSVTLQCSLLSKDKENVDQCPGEHNVYWFRTGSGESHPSIIYTHSEEQKERSCVFSLSKTIHNSSDTGTYYCAVATCGQILFGEGTTVETRSKLDAVVLVLGALLAFSLTLIVILTFYVNRGVCRHCKVATCTICNPRTNEATVDESTDPDGGEEAVNYAALNYSTRKVKKVKQKQELPQECVYSAVRANHTQHHAPV
ncbi:uncharacterized protein LOC117491114 [Trematomus bernacchii]|uniref:uncharacterized protein LOC117491114 n=1 Tax=Trematomus bernacchii TaxID=40690 RepID=UPI00146CAFF7|nr:uncharacterized protein LOC117491114 [Trematomus bernacchii]